MATVRFSDSLKDDIRKNARAMFTKAIDEAKADVPAHWADKFYQSFFPSDVISKFNALPDYAMKTESVLAFGGFFNAPEDVFQTAEHKQKAYECDDIHLTKLTLLTAVGIGSSLSSKSMSVRYSKWKLNKKSF
jgi:hypothetical protein